MPNTVTITTTTAKFPNYPPGSVAIGVSQSNSGFDFRHADRISLRAPPWSQWMARSLSMARKFYGTASRPDYFRLLDSACGIHPGAKSRHISSAVSNPDPGSATTKTISVKVGPGQVVLTLQTE